MGTNADTPLQGCPRQGSTCMNIPTNQVPFLKWLPCCGLRVFWLLLGELPSFPFPFHHIGSILVYRDRTDPTAFLFLRAAFVRIDQRKGSDTIDFCSVLSVSPKQQTDSTNMHLQLDVLQRFLEISHQRPWRQILIIHFGIRNHAFVCKGECCVLKSYVNESGIAMAYRTPASICTPDSSPLQSESTWQI